MAGKSPNKTNKRGRGQPTKLTPKVCEVIREKIVQGHCDWVAARAAGIGKGTLCDWKRWGREGKEPFAQFVEDFEGWEAERLEKLESLYIAKSAIADSPQHIYKLLQVYHPERYQEVQKLEASVKRDVDLSKLSDEELLLWRSLCEKVEDD